MTLLAEKLAALSPKQRQLLELELRKKGIEIGEHQIPPRGEDRDAYPLSFAQQRLWFIDRLVPGNAAYHIAVPRRIAGPVDAQAMRRALTTVAERHEALRTTFTVDGEGQPVQVIHPPREQEMPVIDLSRLGPAARAAESRKSVAANALQTFDLERGPLLRTRLLRLAENEHALLSSMHHIVSDGWSLGVFTRELTEAYRAHHEGRAPALPELPIQYADFSLWQRERFQTEVHDAQLEYWREHLADCPTSLDLPFDRPRPAIQTFAGRSVSASIDEAASAAVRELARRRGTTPFVVLLTAFKALLARYTGRSDVVVGTPLANRNREELEGLIGFFVNTLVLRTDLGPGGERPETGAPSFSEVLDRVWQTHREASGRQDVPFERIVEALEVERNLSHNPLYQVVFLLQTETPAGRVGAPGEAPPGPNPSRMAETTPTAMPAGAAPAGAVGAQGLESEISTTPFDLMCLVLERGARFEAVFQHNVDLFDRTTMSRMLGHYQVMVEALVADPEARPAELPVLSPAERHQIVEEWNDTRSGEAPGHTLQGLFEARVDAWPEAVAVVSDDEELSYAELERRANRLAHLLRELGLERGDWVAIHLERAAEMVTAVMAVLKAGGSYVPVEVSLPPARVKFVLDSLHVETILTQSPLVESLAEIDLPELEHAICLEPGATGGDEGVLAGFQVWAAADLAQRPETRPETWTGRGDVAYVIFTSGSTGTPKGVVVRHDPVLNLIEWVNGSHGVGPEDRVLFLTSLSFDLSVYDVFGLLAAGGSIRVGSSEAVRDPGRLVQMLLEEPVTFWDTAPAALQQLVPFLPERAPTGTTLRLAFNSGDWIPVTLPPRMKSTFPGLEFIALGGATEATVWSNYHRVERVPPTWTSIPYGRPISNARYHVLDDRLTPCPIAVPGDLFIGGECLASGYTDAILTASKFIPDPFGPSPGARLYRTGDRARYFAHGELEFLGRLDHQVKVRGYRIELGEISAVLGEHPEVRVASALALEGETRHQKRLVACVEPRGEAPSVEELRRHLSEKLPEYMVPSAFVFFDALPVTPNGKLDRKALIERATEELEAERHEVGDDFVAPRTEVEEELAAIWRSVLRRDQVGVHDNFFDLGGDSIISIQIVARANKAGLRLTPPQIFQYQTVAELAGVVGTSEEIAAEQGVVTGPVIPTPAQRWFFDQRPSNPHHFNQSVMLHPLEPLEPGLLAATGERLLAHHDALRLRFEREDAESTEWRAHLPGLDGQAGRPPVTTIDLEALRPSAAEHRRIKAVVEAAAAQVQASLDVEAGPLLRLVLMNLGAELGQRLLIVAHHLAIDGVSWRILLGDLESVYHQLENGATPELPPKSTSFKEWGERLVELVRSGAFDEERGYWLDPRRRRAGRLPLEGPEEANTLDTVRRVSVQLEEETTRALLEEVPRAYRTQIGDLLMAALVETFAGWTGSPYLVIELEGHGREEEVVSGVELSLTVGWFTVLYPLLLARPANGGPGELIKAVKEQIRSVPNRGLGHGLLRYLSGDEEITRALSAQGEPEISFNYLGQLDQALAEESRFAGAPESAGPTTAGDQPRRYKLEINSSITRSRLNVAWTYSENLHHRETIERLASDYLDHLRALIEHCRTSEARGLTPSDFPLAEIGQDALDKLLADGVEIEDVYPLGPTQHGLLFFHLYAPHSEAYFQQFRCFFSGELDPEAFKEAWQTVIDHNPALRTSFLWEGVENPVQVVHRRLELPWFEEDWRDRSSAEQQQALEEIRREDRERGLDLSQAPVMRFYLIRLHDDLYHFAWSYHHVLLDGWCLPLLTSEGVAAYMAHSTGREFTPPPRRPYRDYVAWLQRQDMTEAKAFWKKTLAGFTRPTQLPVDLQPGALPSQQGEYRTEVTWLPMAVTDRLREVGQRRQLTLNTLVQGAWALMLGHYSGDRDVVFGVVSSGRPPEIEGVESMIGLFITTLPIRAWIEPGRPLLDWLQALQDQQIEARQYEYCPLVEVQEWSEVPGDQPIFDSIQIFENYPSEAPEETPALENPDQKAEDIEVAPKEEVETSGSEVTISDRKLAERPSYPLAVIVGPGAALYLGLGYDRDRFEDTTVSRMLDQLGNMLRTIAVSPERRVFELSPLGQVERRQLLVEWNDRRFEAPEGATLSELFAAQVERTPDTPAAVCEGRELSYAELAKRSRNLGGVLAGEGVGPEGLVAILARRSLDFLTAILGTFEAGGAYLPLDPLHPAPRLAQVLEQSRAGWVLVEDDFRELLSEASKRLDAAHRPRVLGLSEVLDRPATVQPQKAASAENLAYVIFTSGSTGMPKGAMLEQRGMVNHLWAKIEDLEIGAQDVVAQTASQCFDISVWQFLSPLVVGGRVEIFPDEVAHDPALLIEAVEEREVTILETVPSLLRFLLEEIESGDRPPELESLRWLVPTGEALPPELAGEWLRAYPRIPLVNAYGPTECSDDVSHHVVRRPPDPEAAGVPIGRPVVNLSLYVVDAFYELRALEVPGELMVGGIGVGRGYLGEPRRTAEAFVPDPFSSEAGARLYRTGDLACWNREGALEFLGRLDHQVKVRGFRIELGEIESALDKHPALAHVAVTVWEDEAAQPRLVGYVVAKDRVVSKDEVPASAELKAFLEERLPEYMVPSFFVFLEELPLTANGKLDRKALPAPDRERDGGAEGYAEPRDNVEFELVQIWEDILGTSPIGIRDDFFDLGGHSLLAIRLMTRIRDRLGHRLPLATVFEAGTIAEIASVLRAGHVSARRSALVPIQKQGERAPFFCVHPVGGNVLCYAELARALGPRQPFYGLQRPEPEGDLGEFATVEVLAAHYLEAIRAVEPEGPYRLGGWSVGGRIAYEMARQLEANGEEVERLVVIDVPAPQGVEVEKSEALPGLVAEELDDAQAAALFAGDLGALVGRRIPVTRAELNELGEGEHLPRVVESAQSAGVLPTEMSLEEASLLFEIFKANQQAIRRYQGGDYGGDLVLVRGEDSLKKAKDPTLGWGERAAGGVRVERVPGNHYSLILQPNVQTLSERLKSILDQGGTP